MSSENSLENERPSFWVLAPIKGDVSNHPKKTIEKEIQLPNQLASEFQLVWSVLQSKSNGSFQDDKW